MLHIQLNGITNAATVRQIFCAQIPALADPVDQKVQIELFQNMVMLH